MASCTQLRSEIAELERQTVAIRLKGEEKMEAERTRLQQVHNQREAFAASHAEAMREAADEHERQMMNAMERAERKLAEAAEHKAQALQRIREAEQRSEELETESRELSQRWRLLNSQLDANEAKHEGKVQEVLRDTDMAVLEREEGTKRAIHSTTLFASEMQEISLAAIADMQEDAKTNVKGAESRSLERSRFEEFYNTLQSHKVMELTPEALLESKVQLLQAWLDDWVGHTGKAVPEEQTFLSAPLGPTLTPLSSSRSRAKDIALQKAAMQQLTWCNLNVPA